MKKYAAVFHILFIALFLISCKPKKNVVYMSNDNFAQEVSQAKYDGLHLQEGDRLEILVSAFDEIAVRPFNIATMNRTGNTASGTSGGNTGISPSEYTVNSDGTIIFPVLGAVYCKGMTKQQLKEDLESRLKRYLTDPLVTITLTNFNISVLGEVKAPGQKTSSTEKINLFQAIALAGDLTYDANRTNVKLIRTSAETGKDEVVSLDLSEASIVNSPYYYLQQNDIIYVEPNKVKAQNSSIGSSTTLWFSAVGTLISIASLIVNILR